MVDIQDINKTLETAYKVESVLHTLLDFEDVLERTNLYAYDNWSAGEIALGPDIDKYWVTVTLMYPHRLMPDPAGAERLLKIGAKVFYKKDKLSEPGTIRSMDDVDMEHEDTDVQKGKFHAKPKTSDVWLVTIEMPRSIMKAQDMDKIRFANDEIDMDDVQSAEDEQLDSEEALQNANQ